jgi:hypothetical protein
VLGLGTRLRLIFGDGFYSLHQYSGGVLGFERFLGLFLWLLQSIIWKNNCCTNIVISENESEIQPGTAIPFRFFSLPSEAMSLSVVQALRLRSDRDREIFHLNFLSFLAEICPEVTSHSPIRRRFTVGAGPVTLSTRKMP